MRIAEPTPKRLLADDTFMVLRNTTVLHRMASAIYKFFSRETLRTIRQTEIRSNTNIQREIHALVSLFSRCTDTSVRIEFGNWPKSFRPEINSFLLSFVKESLTNAVKHGMATSIQILCSMNKHHLSITVEDNGIGLQNNEIRYGIGLQSIAETVSQLNGEVKMASHGKGFCIHVQLPI